MLEGLDTLIFDGILLDELLWEYAHMGVPVAEIAPNLIDPNTGQRAAEIAVRLQASSRITKSDLELHWAGTPRDII